MAIYPKLDKPDHFYLFGLHQCSYPRVWTAQEERLFQEIGRRLADALTSLLMLRSLRESERKLEEAQRLAHVGYWERDLETDRITCLGRNLPHLRAAAGGTEHRSGPLARAMAGP